MTKFELDERDDICTVCGNYCKHKKRYFKTETTPDGIKEVELITAHATCRSLIRKKQELEQQIRDIDWKLFALSI